MRWTRPSYSAARREMRAVSAATMSAGMPSHDGALPCPWRSGVSTRKSCRNLSASAFHCAPEPPLDELLWTIAVARIVLPPEIALQAPPNLTGDFASLLDAGIDDWGGVSPVTIDHVNPEAPLPELELLRPATESRGASYVCVADCNVTPPFCA